MTPTTPQPTDREKRLGEIREALQAIGPQRLSTPREGDKFAWLEPVNDEQPPLFGTAGRIRIEDGKALVLILDSTSWLLDQITELQSEGAKFRKWTNLGGVPSGRICTYNPKDHHEIHGGGSSDEAGNHICDVHRMQALESQLLEVTKELDEERKRLAMRAVLAEMDRLSSEVPSDESNLSIVRCHGCGSALIFKWINSGEIEVFHNCSDKYTLADPAQPKTAAVRERGKMSLTEAISTLRQCPRCYHAVSRHSGTGCLYAAKSVHACTCPWNAQQCSNAQQGSPIPEPAQAEGVSLSEQMRHWDRHNRPSSASEYADEVEKLEKEVAEERRLKRVIDTGNKA